MERLPAEKAGGSASESKGLQTAAGTVPLDKVWEAAGPFVAKLGQALIEAVERSNRHTGSITGRLLALIIVCLSALAGTAMYMNHMDTAEKIIIGLISFLGGAAMFSGEPKR